MLYRKSFVIISIWSNFGPEIPAGRGRSQKDGARFRPFQAERIVRSPSTQNQNCSAFHGLSIGTIAIDTKTIVDPQNNY